jgi:uncharacterized delta-60 repeat protein
MAKIKDSGLTPTLMSDSQATALGLKVYSAGIAYNSGIVPTVTSNADGTISAATFLPYQTQNGSWRLKGSCLAHNPASYAFGTGFAGTAVNAIKVQPDGKILVGGAFTSFNGVARNNFVRLNADGSADAAFMANLGSGFNFGVTDIALQNDGKIVVIGHFSSLNGVTRVGLARLNADGTADTAFMTNVGTGFLNSVGNPNKCVLQPDGKIIVVGSFSFYKGVEKNSIIRFNSDGTVDSTFSTGEGLKDDDMGEYGYVLGVALQADGKIVIAGRFDTYNRDYVTAGGASGHGGLVRLTSTGALDTAFKAGIGQGLRYTDFYEGLQSVSVLSDGRILVGMAHDTVWNNVNRGTRLLLCLSTSGAVDATDANLGGSLQGVAGTFQLSDGTILVSSYGNAYNGNTRNFIFKLNSNLTEDTSFYTNMSPALNNIVFAYAQSGTNLFIGGLFTTFKGSTANRIVRVRTDGTAIAGTPTSWAETIGGVTFDATAAQAVTHASGLTTASTSQTVPNTGSIQFQAASNVTSVCWSFDVALTSKPTWAY